MIFSKKIKKAKRKKIKQQQQQQQWVPIKSAVVPLQHVVIDESKRAKPTNQRARTHNQKQSSDVCPYWCMCVCVYVCMRTALIARSAVFDFACGCRRLTFERRTYTRLTHWQAEHLAQESYFQLKRAKVTTAIRTLRTPTCQISSSNNSNNKSKAYMPTLTQLKYTPYYLTKEIVLFASSTQREQQQRGVQIWTRLDKSEEAEREREKRERASKKWDLCIRKWNSQATTKLLRVVNVFVFVPAFQIQN